VTVAADRHLLFGLLALQNGLIDQGQLVAAFQAWTRDKARSLADHLQARGDLTAAKRTLLDALAEVHLLSVSVGMGTVFRASGSHLSGCGAIRWNAARLGGRGFSQPVRLACARSAAPE
jgi:hypothetical protein